MEEGSEDRKTQGELAALGRFVQAFENIVSTIRNSCIHLTIGSRLGITPKDNHASEVHSRVCELIFHHEILSAWPLVVIWRAMIIESIKGMPGVPLAARDTIQGVTNQIVSDFLPIRDERNKLLHATWNIGNSPFSNAFSAGFGNGPIARKSVVSKTGLQEISGLPADAAELLVIVDRCNAARDLIERFLYYLYERPAEIPARFKAIKNGWRFISPDDKERQPSLP